MVADVVFHQFGHKAVDCAAGGGKALENFEARIVFVERAQDAFQLADHFLFIQL